MKPEILLKWFTEELLPIIVKNGNFAEGNESQTLEKCEFETIESYVNSFASIACFSKVTVKSSSGIITRNVLIKFQSQNSLFREKLRTIPQYKNEVALYNEVYPSFVKFLKSCGKDPNFINEVIPKCYFASTGDGDIEKAVVILEDLREEGYKLSDSPTDLNLNHCLLSLEKLAKFHSISFAMKFKEKKTFDKLKTLFSEVLFEDNQICREQSEEFQGFIAQRRIDYLLTQKNSEVPKEYLEKLREILKPTFELQKSLNEPSEPLSVICHGDFNRNNILFRYKNGEVVDAKLIDYQRTFYGPPTQDLGFFIYMNTTLEFREKYFDRLFNHYYQNLVKNISTIINLPEATIADRIPIQAFKDEFEKVAICHYITIAFFLPHMMSPPDPDFEEDIKMSFRKMAEKNLKKGGEAASKRIAEVIIDFYRRKFYMHDYLPTGKCCGKIKNLA